MAPDEMALSAHRHSARQSCDCLYFVRRCLIQHDANTVSTATMQLLTFRIVSISDRLYEEEPLFVVHTARSRANNLGLSIVKLLDSKGEKYEHFSLQGAQESLITTQRKAYEDTAFP